MHGPPVLHNGAMTAPQWQALDPRTQRALGRANFTGRGLEIGPSYSPIAPKSAGFDVQVIDHLDRVGLLAKYGEIGLPQRQLDRIEEVDFVWSGQSLPDLVGEVEAFDFIVAAHVLEHTTDVIGFVGQCLQLLKPTGVLSLIVPDKRYCFDRARPLTTAGQLVEAHLEARTRHGVAPFIDTHLYTLRRFGTENTWNAQALNSLQIAEGTWDAVRETTARVHSSGDYIDIHRWVFTPSSVELLMYDLTQLGYLDVELLEPVSDRGTFEFHLLLTRARNARVAGDSSLASEYRRQMMERIEQEQTWVPLDATPTGVGGRARRVRQRVRREASRARRGLARFRRG